MFMVPGSNNVVRVNGRAYVSAEAALTRSFERGGKTPKTVVVIHVEEIYFQCAKAIMRAGLWSGTAQAPVPSAGAFIRELDESFDADGYDAGYDADARPKMW
jgi:predicted pyridoxine 5'-phosphate oxidase superfamily flavin-nucleotide-binding protein